MKRYLAVVPVLFLLAGCSAPEPSPDVAEPTIDDARANCVTAYKDLPGSVATLAAQSGAPADAETPCDNWIESQGESEFVDFWTDPATFIPYVISQGKLEGLSAGS